MKEKQANIQTDTIPVGQYTPEELKAAKERIALEKQKIINDLNKIKYPLSVTVFTHGQTWTIRNIKFWEVFKKKDDEIVKFMEQYLTENK